jgi:transcriptional regulator with XRE-family HTH domain
MMDSFEFNVLMKRSDRFEGIVLNWRFSEITAGMTQEEIAEKLDCSRATVNMVKSGKRNFDIRWIEVIAEKFKIPKWQLFARPEEVLPPEYLEWLTDYSRLDKDGRRIVDSMLRATRVAPLDEQDDPKKKKTV